MTTTVAQPRRRRRGPMPARNHLTYSFDRHGDIDATNIADDIDGHGGVTVMPQSSSRWIAQAPAQWGRK